MIRHLDYTRGRLVRESERLRALVYPERQQPDELLVAGPVERISREQAQELAYRPAVLGERFGPLWATYWFRVRATVPEAWAGRRVDLLSTSLSEATLWRDGVAVQGLNTGGDGGRDRRPVPPARDRHGQGDLVTLDAILARRGRAGTRGSPSPRGGRRPSPG